MHGALHNIRRHGARCSSTSSKNGHDLLATALENLPGSTSSLLSRGSYVSNRHYGGQELATSRPLQRIPNPAAAANQGTRRRAHEKNQGAAGATAFGRYSPIPYLTPVRFSLKSFPRSLPPSSSLRPLYTSSRRPHISTEAHALPKLESQYADPARPKLSPTDQNLKTSVDTTDATAPTKPQRHWERHGRALERKATAYIERKRAYERKLRVSRDHPVRWDELFALLRRHSRPALRTSDNHAVLPQVTQTLSSSSSYTFSDDVTGDTTSTDGSGPQSDEAQVKEAGRPVASSGQYSQDVLDHTTDHSGRDDADDWTSDQFASAIAYIVTAKAPRQDPTRKGQISLAKQRLRFMMRIASQQRGLLGPHALHQILAYLTLHADLPYARNILSTLSDYGASANSDIINIFISSAAREQNLRSMERYVKMMLHLGFRPTEHTWQALVQAAPGRSEKQRAILETQRLGILRYDQAVDLIPDVLEYSFRAFLDQGGQMERFLETLTCIWGRAWLSESAINKLVDILLRRGMILDVMDLLRHLDEHYDHRPDRSILNTMLSHHARTRDVAGCMKTVNHFQIVYRVEPDRVSYDIVFRLAWAARRYNMIKVIWKYACLTHSASTRMHKYIGRSISAARKPTGLQSVQGRWLAHIPYVLFGDSLPEFGSKYRDGDMSATAKPRKHDGSPSLVDLTTLGSFEPCAAFIVVLNKAWALDRRWSLRRRHKEASASWKTKYSVTVEVRPSPETESVVKKSLEDPGIDRLRESFPGALDSTDITTGTRFGRLLLGSEGKNGSHHERVVATDRDFDANSDETDEDPLDEISDGVDSLSFPLKANEAQAIVPKQRRTFRKGQHRSIARPRLITRLKPSFHRKPPQPPPSQESTPIRAKRYFRPVWAPSRPSPAPLLSSERQHIARKMARPSIRSVTHSKSSEAPDFRLWTNT